MFGTITAEDIYGAGSLDTLPATEAGETQQMANPNNPEVTAGTGGKSIFNIRGSILGQPLIVWGVMAALLVGLKYIIEDKKLI